MTPVCLSELRRLRAEVAHYRAVAISRAAVIANLTVANAARRSGLASLPVCSSQKEKNR